MYLKTLTPERQVSESGLRYYSPRLGRFVSQDPIGEDGGINLYGFVQNGPIGRYDYLGELSCEAKCGALCGAIAAIGCALGCNGICILLGGGPACPYICAMVCGGIGGGACVPICDWYCNPPCKPGSTKKESSQIDCYMRDDCNRRRVTKGTQTVTYKCNSKGEWVIVDVEIDCPSGYAP